MENQKNETNKIAGIIFVGCMFIGIGVGNYMNNTSVGTLIGIGVGFLASAIYRSDKNK
ncbi:hypothetical protein [Flavobacterium sp.]|uniref:hypothetical protein n=1 Tax=Flavobacterium sp. TaxID=239 RepID=UPI00286A3F95|nr:hypothetical protein [Flavobacterium sp.]